MSSDLTPKWFSFKIQFTICDVIYKVNLSSDMVEDEGRVLNRQMITIWSGQSGVTMIRTEQKGGQWVSLPSD